MLSDKRENPNKDAIVEILEETDDVELVKGFVVCHGADFVAGNKIIEIFGLLIEVLYEMKIEEVKKSIKRMLEDEEDSEGTPVDLAGDLARTCSAKYRALFQ